MAKEEDVKKPEFVEDDGSNFIIEGGEEMKAAEAAEQAGGEAAAQEAEAEAKDSPAKEEGPKEAEPKETAFKDLPEGMRKRIARANRQRDEAQAEVAELKAKGKEAPKSEAKDLDPDDFDSFDDFLSARDSKTVEEEAPKEIDGVPNSEFQPVLADLKEKIETQDPDLWEKAATSKDLTISAPLVMAMNEAKNPAAILEHLLAEPDEAKKLSAMSQFGQARAIAKLERAVKAPKKKATSAPEPAETTQARGISPDKTLAEMSQKEFEKARNEQERGGGSHWL